MNGRPRRRLALGLRLGIVALAAAGCSGTTPSRADVVGALTDDRVPARFAAVAASATSLVERAVAFCSSGRDDPTELLDQVTVVREQWAGLRPFWFGPVMDRRARTIVDWPADADGVGALAAGDTPVDAVALRDLVGADQRGLGAIEVLATDGPDDRGCEYLTGSATLVAEETEAVATEWETFGPTLSRDDASANDALADIVSESVFALLLVGSDNQVADAHLAGVRWAIIGPDRDDRDDSDDSGGDGGVDGIASLLDDQVVEQLRTEFDAVAAEPSIATAVALERTVKTNVVGDLGITVSFSDADGDG